MFTSITSITILAVGAFALVNADCGRPTVAPDTTKIVGGTNAKPYSWPWQGVFKKKSGWFGSYRFICGGTLIAPNWFMTAAHCVDGDLRAGDYEVQLGVYNRNSPESGKAQTIKAKSVHEYSKYSASTTSFDISLIELSSPAQITDQVSPVCLPRNDTAVMAAGQNVIVTGWGTTSSGGSVSRTLRQVTVPIVPFDTCNSEYDGAVVQECMFCAGVGGKDSCQGDSGGPVVSQQNGQWFQYGITSWGYGCAQEGYPGVYSRVTDYCQFITDTTGLNLCH